MSNTDAWDIFSSNKSQLYYLLFVVSEYAPDKCVVIGLCPSSSIIMSDDDDLDSNPNHQSTITIKYLTSPSRLARLKSKKLE